LTPLARRAYRRPVTNADIQPLLAIYKEGRQSRDFDGGIERALEALLSSPKFLIRLEREPEGAARNVPYRVTDLELASRLSFFLWKSIPDDELLDVASRNQLKDPAVVAAQVRRMLADRRATRFTNDFSGQWLEVRNIQSQNPDELLYSAFDDSLRKAMIKETQLFFESQVREDRPLQELLTANYTFLNDQLARHYGMNDLYGSHFRRVTVTDEARQGLLGHASVLMTTSYADRTSVVLRGKWILENILGAPPPPPPPNVPPLKASDRAAPKQPGLRQLPPPHGSARFRDGALRRHRQVARHRFRRGDQREDRARGQDRRQPQGVSRSTPRAGERRLRPHGHREAHDLRDRARHRPRRRADRAAAGA
jgi:hypothetical protein